MKEIKKNTEKLKNVKKNNDVKKIKSLESKNKEAITNNVKNDNKIIPAYEQKGNTKLKRRDLLFFLPESKKIRIAFVAGTSLIIIGLIIWLCIFMYNAKYGEYFKYEEKMKVYGFDRVYDSGTAKTSDTVTKSEAIKLIIASVYNVYNIDNFIEVPEDNFQNAIWLRHAYDIGIVTNTEINKENSQKGLSYVDAIRYFANAKVKMLKKDLTTTSHSKITNVDSFKSDEKNAIIDMALNNIIDNVEKNLDGNQTLFKGLLNKMIINFVEVYNTITINGQKININPDKVAKNASEYPYILSNVSKDVYEIPNYIFDVGNYKLPKDIYANRKEYFYQIDEVIKIYLDTVLNINYETINADKFYSNLGMVSLYPIDKDLVNKYVEYVKANKIVIEGSAKVQYPAIYYDGKMYRVRTKILYNIKSGNNLENLFFMDVDQKYTLGNKSIVLDIPIGRTIDSNDMYISIEQLNSSVAGKINPYGGE